MKTGPFIKKEILHVLRDKRMLLVVIAIPIVQMLLFGFAISMEVNNINVMAAYIEYDASVGEKVERIAANPYVTFRGQVAPTAYDEVMKRGEADAVVIFNGADDVQIITDASNPVLAQSATAYISAILSGAGQSDLIDTHLLYNPQLRSAYNFVPGIMGMVFLLVCALMTAVSIVREKENGTMELLLASPVSPGQIIISKMVPFFLLSCIDLSVILLIAKFLLDVPLSAGVVSVVLVSLLYILLSLAFGLLVSTLADSQVAAMLICGMVMIMPVIMLSGMVFPIDNLPPVLAQISWIVPAQWYIDAMRKLMVEGLPIADAALDVAILAAMTLLLLVVSIRKFKIRLS